MLVDFSEQVFCNFKAFSGEHFLPLDLPGVTFVCGENRVAGRLESNGAAKSSLWDALCWGLYGKTPAGLRNPDIVPWATKETPQVTITVRIGGKQHRIFRSANPNRLLVDDKGADQDVIDNLLGLNFELFTNTVLLAQGEPLFFDRTPAAKMALLSDTLQLDRWDTRAAAALAVVASADAEIQSLELTKQTVEGKLQELDGLLAQVKSKADDWAAQARLRRREAANTVAVLQEQVEEKAKRLASAKLREDEASLELRSCQAEAIKLEKEESNIRRTLDKWQGDIRFNQQQTAEYKSELERLIEAKLCPTCGQPVKPKDLDKHKHELESRLSKLRDSLPVIPDKLVKNLSVIEQRRVQNESYLQSFQAKVDSANAELSHLHPESASLNARLGELRRALETESINPYTEQVSNLTARRKQLEADLPGVIKSLREAAQKQEHGKFWGKGFKEIKLRLVEIILQELELATNSMLEQVGLVDWLVHYGIERETKSGSIQRALHIQINSPQSEGFVRWESWSGGERQRLRLIGALALADVLLNYAGVSTSLEILDEPALYWSGQGVQDLCVFLAGRAKDQNKSIYYTEHSARQSALFSQVVTVIRDKQGAYIADK